MTDLIALSSAFLTATGLFFTALGATATYNEPLKVFCLCQHYLCQLFGFSIVMVALRGIWKFRIPIADSSSRVIYPGLGCIFGYSQL